MPESDTPAVPRSSPSTISESPAPLSESRITAAMHTRSTSEAEPSTSASPIALSTALNRSVGTHPPYADQPRVLPGRSTCIAATAQHEVSDRTENVVTRCPAPFELIRPSFLGQASAPAGSTKRSGVRGPTPPPSPSREPCRPCREGVTIVASGIPAWAVIHAMTAAESAPSARIAARSITSPPET
jgi:hypothetical protein